MRSREDLMVKVREALRHPKADLLFEIGLEESTPTKAAQRAQQEGLSNEEEKLVKWIAVFKRDHGDGWFRALRGIIENTETENSEMVLTKEEKRSLESLTKSKVREMTTTFINRGYGREVAEVLVARWDVAGISGEFFNQLRNRCEKQPAFDPRKVKEEYLRKYMDACDKGYFLPDLLGMDTDTALENIPDPEPGHESYLLVVNCLPLARLMKFILVDGKRGECLMNENNIESVVETPRTLFYWIYDVDAEAGTGSTEGMSAFEAEELICTGLIEQRRGLTVREAVCLIICDSDSLLNSLGYLCVGSRIEGEFVPALGLLYYRPAEAKVCLTYTHFDGFRGDLWITPTCLKN